MTNQNDRGDETLRIEAKDAQGQSLKTTTMPIMIKRTGLRSRNEASRIDEDRKVVPSSNMKRGRQKSVPTPPPESSMTKDNNENDATVNVVLLNNLPPLISTLTLDAALGDDLEQGAEVTIQQPQGKQQKHFRPPSPATTASNSLEHDNNRSNPYKSNYDDDDDDDDEARDNSYSDESDSSSKDSLDYDRLVCDEERIKFYLAKRNFHLPPNETWWQDWVMYFSNNHLIFGLCCSHSLHPLKLQERLLMLFTSLTVGLGATCAVVLIYADLDEDLNKEFVGVDFLENHYSITQGMIALWTYGSGFHTIFDFMVWHVMVCAFCQQGGPLAFGKLKGCKFVGQNLGLLLCIIAVGMSAGFIWQRITYEGHGKFQITALQFCLGYLIETALALFLYTPIFGTILFSGILGCHRVPVLGGRPADVRSHERWRKAQVKQRKKSVEKSLQQQRAYTNTDEDDYDEEQGVEVDVNDKARLKQQRKKTKHVANL